MYARLRRVHLGSLATRSNDVSFPQSQIAVGKLLLYLERFAEDIGIIDFMGQ